MAESYESYEDIITKELLERMDKMLGYVPVGTVDLLHILTHPDVIELTKDYIKHFD